MQDAVAGLTNGGSLSLNQTAHAGDGGNSDTGAGGNGGAASSTLAFDDTNANAAQSASLAAAVAATGGNGGHGSGGSGTAGSATASDSLTGAATVNSQALASGGTGAVALGGNASATDDATGISATAYAQAVGGSGSVRGGSASASATGHGQSGTATANAQTAEQGDPANAVLTAQVQAQASVATTSVAQADLQYGNTAFAFITGVQAVANADLAPAASSGAVTNVLNANAAIKTAFGTKPVFYGVGELGGGHATGGASSLTSTSSFTLGIDQSKVPAGGSLVVGLEGGTVTGHGVTSVSFTVTVNGATEAALSFTNDTAAQARAAFTDMAFNLGPLAGSGTLDVRFDLSVTSNAAGSGFYGGFIVGDPPAASGLHGMEPHKAGLGAELRGDWGAHLQAR